ncbi:hypothetical protein TRFO_43136 [Tritrichomonas foetus]|uniref:Uncharacterized protein n=1 Tax=Tritrichomonas foetus TaxID=1144522 RepID=A0A1J4KSH7_9EUKA|nr:hypothetical protein TRFO_43136 [Tritrichomonas foetus]|eukprot:OHT14239.1 hypothetical protein TRFO_43136 [Tritrichomonas foetus]
MVKLLNTQNSYYSFDENPDWKKVFYECTKKIFEGNEPCVAIIMKDIKEYNIKDSYENKLKKTIFNLARLEVYLSNLKDFQQLNDNDYFFPFEIHKQMNEPNENLNQNEKINEISTFLTHLFNIQMFILMKFYQVQIDEFVITLIYFMKKIHSTIFFLEKYLLSLFEKEFQKTFENNHNSDDETFPIKHFYQIIEDVTFFPNVNERESLNILRSINSIILSKFPNNSWVKKYRVPIMIENDFIEEDQASLIDSYFQGLSFQIFSYFIKISDLIKRKEYSDLDINERIFTEILSDYIGKKRICDILSVNMEKIIQQFLIKILSLEESFQSMKLASDCLDILKLALSLMYQAGANIESLSKINIEILAKQGNFKTHAFEYIQRQIKKTLCLKYSFSQKIFYSNEKIDSNLSFDFKFDLTGSPTNKSNPNVSNITKSDDVKSIIIKILDYDGAHDNQTNICSNNFSHIGVDLFSCVKNLIGLKRMNILIRNLIQEIKVLTESFILSYKQFIPNLIFNSDFSEYRTEYELKRAYDSYMNCLLQNDFDFKPIATIGNLLALISLFDSVLATEKVPNDLISMSMKSLVLNAETKNQQQNYFIEACRIIYLTLSDEIILFNSETSHARFFEFASVLIYSFSNNFLLNSSGIKNDEIVLIQSDGLIIATSVMLELLNQYDAFSLISMIESALQFKKKDESFRNRMQLAYEIMTIYHYSLNNIVTTPLNTMVHYQPDFDSEAFSSFIFDLMKSGTRYIAILSEKNTYEGNKRPLKFQQLVFLKKSQINTICFSISPELRNYQMHDVIRYKNISSEDEYVIDNSIIVNNLKSFLPNENGSFELVIIKKFSFLEDFSTHDLFSTFNKLFPVVIKDFRNELHLTHRVRPMPDFVSPQNYVISKNHCFY